MTHSATAAAASRLDFLRTAGAAVAAGVVLLPKASHAEVFTDDVLGFKMDVSSTQTRLPLRWHAPSRWRITKTHHAHK